MKIEQIHRVRKKFWTLTFEGVVTEEGLLEIIHRFKEEAGSHPTIIGMGDRHCAEYVRLCARERRGDTRARLDYKTREEIIHRFSELRIYARGCHVRLAPVPMLPNQTLLVGYRQRRR